MDTIDDDDDYSIIDSSTASNNHHDNRVIDLNDLPPTVEVQNNLLLRMTIVQIAGINKRLDRLHASLDMVLSRTGSHPQEGTHAQQQQETPQPKPSSTTSSPQPSPMLRLARRNRHNMERRNGSNGSIRCVGSQISEDIISFIDAKVSELRMNILEAVSETMDESMTRTSAVIDRSMKKLGDDITKIIDRSIMTHSTVLDSLRADVTVLQNQVKLLEIRQQRDGEAEELMLKLKETVCAAISECTKEIKQVMAVQEIIREQILLLEKEMKLNGTIVCKATVHDGAHPSTCTAAQTAPCTDPVDVTPGSQKYAEIRARCDKIIARKEAEDLASKIATEPTDGLGISSEAETRVSGATSTLTGTDQSNNSTEAQVVDGEKYTGNKIQKAKVSKKHKLKKNHGKNSHKH